MPTLTIHPWSSASEGPPVQLGGAWWPDSPDLGAGLRALIPILDIIRGPVTRLVLAFGTWSTRPTRIDADGRTISIGYASRQPITVIRAYCADGGAFTVRMTPLGPAPGCPPDESVGEAEGGGLGRAVR
jgi:hypothetical protein